MVACINKLGASRVLSQAWHALPHVPPGLALSTPWDPLIWRRACCVNIMAAGAADQRSPTMARIAPGDMRGPAQAANFLARLGVRDGARRVAEGRNAQNAAKQAT